MAQTPKIWMDLLLLVGALFLLLVFTGFGIGLYINSTFLSFEEEAENIEIKEPKVTLSWKNNDPNCKPEDCTN